MCDQMMSLLVRVEIRVYGGTELPLTRPLTTKEANIKSRVLRIRSFG